VAIIAIPALAVGEAIAAAAAVSAGSSSGGLFANISLLGFPNISGNIDSDN